jgi:hypothetical protein
MPPTRTPWTEAVARAVGADWTPIEAVVEVGMRAVPPGRALQHREYVNRHQRDGTAAQRPVTDDQAITVGARSLARIALNGLVKRGVVERRGDQVRRTS